MRGLVSGVAIALFWWAVLSVTAAAKGCSPSVLIDRNMWPCAIITWVLYLIMDTAILLVARLLPSSWVGRGETIWKKVSLPISIASCLVFIVLLLKIAEKTC